MRFFGWTFFELSLFKENHSIRPTLALSNALDLGYFGQNDTLAARTMLGWSAIVYSQQWWALVWPTLIWPALIRPTLALTNALDLGYFGQNDTLAARTMLGWSAIMYSLQWWALIWPTLIWPALIWPTLVLQTHRTLNSWSSITFRGPR